MTVEQRREPVIASIWLYLAAALCVLAVFELPYGYYKFLRIYVCGVSGFAAWKSQENQLTGWAIALVLVAILFNPLVPVHLSREIWFVLDLGAAAIFLAAVRSTAAE